MATSIIFYDSIDFYKSIGAVPMEDWMIYRLTEEKLRAFAEKEIFFLAALNFLCKQESFLLALTTH